MRAIHQKLQLGMLVGIGTEITGFENGEAATHESAGTAFFAPNAQGNILTCTRAGVVSSIVCGAEKIDFGTKLDFGMSQTGRPYFVVGSLGFGEVSTGANLQALFGYVLLTGGGRVVNDSAKAAQISVTI